MRGKARIEGDLRHEQLFSNLFITFIIIEEIIKRYRNKVGVLLQKICNGKEGI